MQIAFKLNPLRSERSERYHLNSFYSANQRVTERVIDLNVEELTCLSTISIEDNDSVARCASNHLNDMSVWVRLSRFLARALYQYFYRSPNKFQVILFCDRILYSKQFIVAANLNFPGDVVFQTLGRLRAWANTVLKNETVLKSASLDQANRLLEIVFCFSTKPDNEIAAH